MSDKFGDERDPYLYPALNVLRNRLGIRQAKNLQQAAFELSLIHISEPTRHFKRSRMPSSA